MAQKLYSSSGISIFGITIEYSNLVVGVSYQLELSFIGGESPFNVFGCALLCLKLMPAYNS
jgi:hypothetical protein